MSDAPITRNESIALQKSMAWERAKGELMSMVAAEGCKIGSIMGKTGKYSFEVLQERIEAFIAAIEEEEFHI